MSDDQQRSAKRPATGMRQPSYRSRPVREKREGRSREKPSWEGRLGVDLRSGALGALGVSKRWVPAGESPAKQGKRPRGTLPPAPPQPLAPLLPPPAPKRRKRRWRPRLLALIVAQVAFATTIVWALTSPTWQVRYVQVVGTDDATLTQAIEALPLTGCNIFRCDTQSQMRQVERLPLVASVQIHAAYPDGLIVEVAPRHPTLLWHLGGTAYVVASDGTVLGRPDSDPAFAGAALQDVQDNGAVAFSGRAPSAGTHMPAAVADMARQLRSGLPAALGSGWSLQLTANDGFVAMQADGTRIVFGTPVDAASAGGTGAVGGVATQIDELRGLLAALAARGEQPAVIDLRWGGHPYYRLAGT